MSNLRGGFDLDGVLALTQQSLFKELQARGLLRHRKFEEMKRWAMEDNFPSEISTKDVISVFRSPNFWENLEVCPFLLASAKDLVDRGVKLHIVTARTSGEFVGNMKRITEHWLGCHGISYENLAFVPADDKHLYCAENKLTFFVEDRVDTAISVAHNNYTESFLVFAPYNEGPAGRPWMFPEVHAMSRPYYPNFYNIHYRVKD